MFAACKAIASWNPGPARSRFSDAVARFWEVRGGSGCSDGGDGGCGGSDGGGYAITFVENTKAASTDFVRVSLSLQPGPTVLPARSTVGCSVVTVAVGHHHNMSAPLVWRNDVGHDGRCVWCYYRISREPQIVLILACTTIRGLVVCCLSRNFVKGAVKLAGIRNLVRLFLGANWSQQQQNAGSLQEEMIHNYNILSEKGKRWCR